MRTLLAFLLLCNFALAQPPGPPPDRAAAKAAADADEMQAAYWWQDCETSMALINHLLSQIQAASDGSAPDEVIVAEAEIDASDASNQYTLLKGKYDFDYNAAEAHYEDGENASSDVEAVAHYTAASVDYVKARLHAIDLANYLAATVNRLAANLHTMQNN